MTGSAVTLTGSTYSLLGGTLAATGCVRVTVFAHHSTGTTASTLNVYVGTATYSEVVPITTSEAEEIIEYCNNGSTGAGSQSFTRENSYNATGAVTPAWQTFTQASTGALSIYVQATATSGDYWQLDKMRVDLIQ